ncbi:MerR family transcriptional regulator [Methylobacterium brachiatum]|uniref:MerR family transcriptional regulator n=1 Tax=Methylobacterium brachiatum TaxID=269660 RepID=UPI002448A67E|nr:MerR family transcriptional regulator [Methylobacterium brachiatum]MDH2313999.1 MerR family transcriptional regulator [Methylobacterium brachiatum]
MNAHASFTVNGLFGSAKRPDRWPDPPAPGPNQPGRFPLRRLVAISGVDSGTIETWTGRRIFDRPTGNDGKHRRFDFWDALHLAILREMRALGMQLSGRGAILAESLLACAKVHVAWEGDLNFVPERIAIYALHDVAEWQMDLHTLPDRLPRSYVVLNLRAVVEDVNRRYHAQP